MGQVDKKYLSYIVVLKAIKAECIKRTPLTIKLAYETTSYTQDLTIGIDKGIWKIGSSVVNDGGEVEVGNDIT